MDVIKKRYLNFFVLMLLIQITVAQHQSLSHHVPEKVSYDPEKVIHPRYGIKMYEGLNIVLKGDSTRMCKGYACSGWVEDYYNTGATLHRGYYSDGHLKMYKNYYANGILEREFRETDDYHSVMKTYYMTGVPKSEAKYVEGEAIKWQDFYANGQLEYIEEYNKGFDYYIKQNSYFPNGTPSATFELEHKKKLLFKKAEYHASGNLKAEGMVNYNMNMFDYQKTGKWLIYDEQGAIKREEVYVKGELTKEKDY